jgi:hypothetical protein
MTTQPTSRSLPRIRPPRNRLRHAALALGAGALALAAIVAVQRAGDDTTTGNPPAPATEAVAASTAATAPPRVTIYLTDSAEQATALEQDLPALFGAFGGPNPAEMLFLAAGSPEELASARHTISLIEDEFNGRGVQLVDLRQSTTSQPSTGAGGCDGGLAADLADTPAC